MPYLLLIIIPISIFLLMMGSFLIIKKINSTISLKANTDTVDSENSTTNQDEALKISFFHKNFNFISIAAFTSIILGFIIFWIVKKAIHSWGLVVFLLLIIALFVLYAILLNKYAKKYHINNWLFNFYSKDKVKTVLSSFISIFIGLFIGVLIIFCFANSRIGGTEITINETLNAIRLLFFGVLHTGRDKYGLLFGWNGTNIGDVLFKATPLILTGLSVGVAFKTGLFNIGAPGQYLMGIASSCIIALSIPSSVLPPFIIWILAFLGAIISGALWGAISGALKAFLNVNEVITCIMTNWIAANLVTLLFDKTIGPFNNLLDPSPTKNNAFLYKTSFNNVATSKLGLDKIFPGSQVNGGIIIAIIIAVIVFIILDKTKFGYELKACGSNRHASKYAGIKDKKCIILSMAIAGALAGAGAALFILSGNTEFKWETYQSLPSTGFNGIPVSLLAINNPLGTCLSGIFMAYLDIAGQEIKKVTTYNEHITSIISAIIVYFSAFSLIIKELLNRKKKAKPVVIESNEPSTNNDANTDQIKEEE